MSKSGKIVHVCILDKFIPPFIDFVEEHFDDFEDRHIFWVKGDTKKYPYRASKNIISTPLSKIESIFSYIQAVNSADKIILHGLFQADQIICLSVMPWLHKKCYWVIWGGDLYSRQLANKTVRWHITEVFRRWLIPRIGHLVTHVEGDIDRAREWYKAKGRWHECFMYTSNLFQSVQCQPRTDSRVNILIGNSADPNNNHLEILDKLLPYKSKNIQIYAPLSYGNQDHAKTVRDYGKRLFSHKFTALAIFMTSRDYLSFLSSIDVAIFNHSRQQAMGNITNLLGMGKPVFIRRDTTPWLFFKSLGITLYEFDSLDSIDILEIKNESDGVEKIKRYFSINNLVNQLDKIFE